MLYLATLSQKTRQYIEISILKALTARDGHGEFVGLDFCMHLVKWYVYGNFVDGFLTTTDYWELTVVGNERQTGVFCSIENLKVFKVY